MLLSVIMLLWFLFLELLLLNGLEFILDLLWNFLMSSILQMLQALCHLHWLFIWIFILVIETINRNHTTLAIPRDIDLLTLLVRRVFGAPVRILSVDHLTALMFSIRVSYFTPPLITVKSVLQRSLSQEEEIQELIPQQASVLWWAWLFYSLRNFLRAVIP